MSWKAESLLTNRHKLTMTIAQDERERDSERTVAGDIQERVRLSIAF